MACYIILKRAESDESRNVLIQVAGKKSQIDHFASSQSISLTARKTCLKWIDLQHPGRFLSCSEILVWLLSAADKPFRAPNNHLSYLKSATSSLHSVRRYMLL
jgi:hypothetical protein